MKEARNCYAFASVAHLFPSLGFSGSVTRNARVRRSTLQLYWEIPGSAMASQTFYTREANAELSYSIDSLYDISRKDDAYAQLLGALSNHTQRKSAFAHRLYFLITTIQAHKKLTAEYKKAVEAFTSARIAIEEKASRGEIHNEAYYQNDVTLAQIITKESEARSRYIDTRKKYKFYKKELELMLNVRIPAYKIQEVKLPQIKRIPKLQDFMKRNQRLIEAYSNLVHASAKNTKAKLSIFAPNARIFSRSRYVYDINNYLYDVLPVYITVGAHIEHRMGMDQVTQISSSKYELAKARCTYCEQYTQALERAYEQINSILDHADMLYTYETAMYENEKEVDRLGEIFRLDPYDQVAAQKYGDAVVRYAESVERFTKHTSLYAELYFTATVKLPRELRKLHLPTPRSTMSSEAFSNKSGSKRRKISA
jgi:hypothetical protein